MGIQLAASSPAYVTSAVVVTGVLLLIYLLILASRSRVTSQRLDRAEQILADADHSQSDAATSAHKLVS